MPGVGSADRIAIDVSERTNISRKYASAVKHAFELAGLDAFGDSPRPGRSRSTPPSSRRLVVVHVVRLHVEDELVAAELLERGVAVDASTSSVTSKRAARSLARCSSPARSSTR